MGRKFRSTEVSGEVKISTNGQHVHCNWFCVNCHAICGERDNVTHYKECEDPEVYAIPAEAEVPKKRASKRKWKIFKDQFVYAKPLSWWGYWAQSWWHNNKENK